MKPTLLVLAAGMASRYGSLKQMDGVGPSNETIIDYTIYDAIKAGYGKVVFVIRGSFEEQFKEIFNKERFNGQIEVDYVMQELDKLPAGYTVPEGREKPWGTAHAVMMAAPAIQEPFAVVNGDDFYGADAISKMGEFLKGLDGKKGEFTMVGYELKRTLSENGSVSRGVCEVTPEGMLKSMTERTQIERQDGKIVFVDENGATPLAEETPVSMNLFGFTPDFFTYSENFFRKFLDTQAKENLKAEFFIPLVVAKMIEGGEASMKVLNTSSDWFGVTYAADRPDTVKKLQALVDAGQYPVSLW